MNRTCLDVLAMITGAAMLAACCCACSAGDGAAEPEPATRPSTVRLIDQTDEGSVVSSPLLDPLAGLDEIEQQWTATELVAAVDERGDPCWLASTRHRAVSGTPLDDAPGIQVWHSGHPLQAEPTAQHFGYSYREGAQSFDARFEATEVHGADNRFDQPGRAEVAWTLMLPEGATTFDVGLLGGWVMADQSRCEVLLDGEVVGRLPRGEVPRWRFTQPVECGSHELAIELEWVGPTVLDALPTATLDVTSTAGLLSVRPPPGSDEAPGGTFEAHYLADVTGSGRGDLLRSWNESRPIDPRAGGDPLGLTRKQLEGSTVREVIWAPAPTVLRYEVRVPEHGQLRFGMGVAGSGYGSGPERVRFRVCVEGERGCDEVFAQALAPRPDPGIEPLEHRTADLSHLSGQQVVLRLATEVVEHDGPGRTHLSSYWHDPAVHTSVATAPPGQIDEPAARPVNVILVSLDTLRADHLHLYGYARDTCPHLDALASDSVVFLDAHSQYPTTAVSHMSMFTSRYPHRSPRALQAEYGTAFDESIGSLDEPTLASLMQRNGWLTGAFTGGGAVHWSRGFDHGFASYDCRDEDDSAESLYDRAEAWLRLHRDAPFLLFLHTYQIHGPYGPPAPYNRAFVRESPSSLSIDPMTMLRSAQDVCTEIPDDVRYDMVAQYDGDIRYTDDELIGPLIDTLEGLGLYDDTMLIITSDHGEEFGEHGCWTHGSNLYEETMHVPLIIKYPHGRHGGTQVIGQVELLDILPTIVAETGIGPDSLQLEGENLEGFVSGTADQTRRTREAAGLRFTTTADSETVRSVAIEEFYLRRGRHKLIVTEYDDAADAERLVEPRMEVYDLRKDRGELSNVAAERARKREMLLTRARTLYDPDALLGVVGQIIQEEGDRAWKQHLFELGYTDDEP